MPEPIEKTDPEFAKLLKWYCNMPDRPRIYSTNEYNFIKKSVKVGRNNPCMCGSGKKYKRCCL